MLSKTRNNKKEENKTIEVALKKVFKLKYTREKHSEEMRKDKMRKDEYYHPHRINMANGSLRKLNREVREMIVSLSRKVGEVYKNQRETEAKKQVKLYCLNLHTPWTKFVN